MKICSNCGVPLAPNVKLCPFCGNPINTPFPQPPSTSSTSTPEDITKLPWVFIGAYAIYSGTAILRNIGYVDAIGRIDVTGIDISNKRWKAKMETTSYTKILGKQLKLSARTKELWYPIGEFACESEQANKRAEYEGGIRIGNGVKNCIVYEYIEGLNTELIFWDKELKFPLKYLIMMRRRQDNSNDLSKDIGKILRTLWNVGNSPERLLNGNSWSVDDLLKEFRNSNNTTLRETLLVLNLRETNIQGLMIDNK